MRVRTIKQHLNLHKPKALKNVGRKYEVSEAEGANLIAMGLVEEDRVSDEL